MPGCEKCDYTGFSYGKIPCVCTENKVPDLTGRVTVNGVPVDYDIDNQFKPEPDGDINVNYDNSGMYFKDGKIVKPINIEQSVGVIQIGDPVSFGGVYIGRALGVADQGGLVDVRIYDGSVWKIATKDLSISDKCLSIDLPVHDIIEINVCKECGHSL